MDKANRPPVWNQSTKEVIRSRQTDPEAGLSADEARRRLEEYGPNRIDTTQRTSPWKILLRQFANIIMVLLAIAAVLSLAFGHHLDGFAILTLMLVNAGIGFATELQSAKSLESLSEMDTRKATVIRDGERRQVPAPEVVPGDICILDEGDVAPADLRLFESEGLEVDESSLTGESLSVEKQTSEIPADTPLGDRTNMVYKGTGIQKGDGRGAVVATGMNTEVGTIARLATEAEGGSDPLTRQLDALASLLVKAIIAVSIVVGVIGVLGGKDMMVMLETTIALIVAAVPEGLPVVATLALARGMYRMARRNALVRRLAAVQTLGSTTVILTDKTGTLTENRMAVRR
ncbi:MAG: HAD-IC family P-type ATPase, partial [Spirochaetaceae bacterium]